MIWVSVGTGKVRCRRNQFSSQHRVAPNNGQQPL